MVVHGDIYANSDTTNRGAVVDVKRVTPSVSPRVRQSGSVEAPLDQEPCPRNFVNRMAIGHNTVQIKNYGL